MKKEYYKEVIGKQMIHEETNENGMMIRNFVGSTNMYIISIKFAQKRERKITK